MPLEVRNNPVFVILWASLVVMKSKKSRKINKNYENHWFSTAKFKHFDDFMSHKLLIFVYFLSYLYTCATGMNFCDNHCIINIYNRMFWFFDEIYFFRDFFCYFVSFRQSISSQKSMKINEFSWKNELKITKSTQNIEKNEFHRKIKTYDYK